MRTRMAWLSALFLLGFAGFTTWSLTHGQSPGDLRLDTTPAGKPAATPLAAAPASAIPAAPTLAPAAKAVPEAAARPMRDLSKLTPLQRQMYLSVLSAAEWLYGANRTDGRFVHGYLPAVNQAMEGDHYLRQAGAAAALARAARFTGDERFSVRATQAVLTLLGDTIVDSREPEVRYSALPSSVVNRLAAAGLLVLAIDELPEPQDDLLKQAEQLCNFIRRQQRADGSLAWSDAADAARESAGDPEGINQYPGVALYGLARCQQRRPAPWKDDVLRKALAFYRPWWRGHKSPTFAACQTAAFTEAFLRTKEQPFADYVNEMNDWLCGLQYERLDPRRPLWVGGFMSWVDGKPVETAPDISSASCAESLAEACRVAREAGDVTHYRRYSEALERGLQFLTTLQYAEANTQHFAPWYRQRLVGAYHASDQDGNLRIDYTQHAICAMIQYLAQVFR